MLETVQVQANGAISRDSVLNPEITYITENTIYCNTLPDIKG